MYDMGPKPRKRRNSFRVERISLHPFGLPRNLDNAKRPTSRPVIMEGADKSTKGEANWIMTELYRILKPVLPKSCSCYRTGEDLNSRFIIKHSSICLLLLLKLPLLSR